MAPAGHAAPKRSRNTMKYRRLCLNLRNARGAGSPNAYLSARRMKQRCLQVAITWLVGCLLASSSRAADHALIRQFLESAYALSYNPETEMTDVVLQNAYLTDQVRIEQLADRTVSAYMNAAPEVGLTNVLQKIFDTPGMTAGASTELFRERTAGKYYRLDQDSPAPTSYATNGTKGSLPMNIRSLRRKSVCRQSKGRFGPCIPCNLVAVVSQ